MGAYQSSGSNIDLSINEIDLKRNNGMNDLYSFFLENPDIDKSDYDAFTYLLFRTMWSSLKITAVFIGFPSYFYRFGLPDTPVKMLKALGVAYVSVPIYFKAREEKYYYDKVQEILIVKYQHKMHAEKTESD